MLPPWQEHLSPYRSFETQLRLTSSRKTTLTFLSGWCGSSKPTCPVFLSLVALHCHCLLPPPPPFKYESFKGGDCFSSHYTPRSSRQEAWWHRVGNLQILAYELVILGYVLGLEGLSPLGLFLKSTQPRPNLNVTFSMKPFPPPALGVLAPSTEVR